MNEKKYLSMMISGVMKNGGTFPMDQSFIDLLGTRVQKILNKLKLEDLELIYSLINSKEIS